MILVPPFHSPYTLLNVLSFSIFPKVSVRFNFYSKIILLLGSLLSFEALGRVGWTGYSGRLVTVSPFDLWMDEIGTFFFFFIAHRCFNTRVSIHTKARRKECELLIYLCLDQ